MLTLSLHPKTAPESKAQPRRGLSRPQCRDPEAVPWLWGLGHVSGPRVTLVCVLSRQELQNALQQRLLLRPAGVLLAAEEEGVQQHGQRGGPGDPQVWGLREGGEWEGTEAGPGWVP